uniref:Tetrahydrofolate dehydrogenase/cyclohydrolase NAD(P)-binding domain-containing protein n=1 Tax=Ailuropoda melanoleuca TaxID=9646 RepID=A0A7N5JA47_AILME
VVTFLPSLLPASPTVAQSTPYNDSFIPHHGDIPTLGKNVAVAGRSKNVGMPIAVLQHTDVTREHSGGNATVTISHQYTPKEQLKKHTVLADIVVSAAGIPNLITADTNKEGAALINVEIKRVRDPIMAKAKLVGDYITPVCGGVGPMTVTMLMNNTIIAAKKVLSLEEWEVLKPKECGVVTNYLQCLLS